MAGLRRLLPAAKYLRTAACAPAENGGKVLTGRKTAGIYNTFVCNWDWSSKNWETGSERDPCDINGPPIDKWKFYTWDSETAIFAGLPEWCVCTLQGKPA